MLGYDDNENSPITTESSSNYLTKTFFRMFLGLLATAFAAGYTYYSGIIVNLVYSNAFFVIFILELVVVIAFSAGFRKFSSGVVTALFFVYSILTGVTFSTLFAVFELSSIMYAFLGSAALFGILALIRKKYKSGFNKIWNNTFCNIISWTCSFNNKFICNE